MTYGGSFFLNTPLPSPVITCHGITTHHQVISRQHAITPRQDITCHDVTTRHQLTTCHDVATLHLGPFGLHLGLIWADWFPSGIGLASNKLRSVFGLAQRCDPKNPGTEVSFCCDVRRHKYYPNYFESNGFGERRAGFKKSDPP